MSTTYETTRTTTVKRVPSSKKGKVKLVPRIPVAKSAAPVSYTDQLRRSIVDIIPIDDVTIIDACLPRELAIGLRDRIIPEKFRKSVRIFDASRRQEMVLFEALTDLKTAQLVTLLVGHYDEGVFGFGPDGRWTLSHS